MAKKNNIGLGLAALAVGAGAVAAVTKGHKAVGLCGRRHEGTAGEEDLRELARRLLPDFRGSAGE